MPWLSPEAIAELTATAPTSYKAQRKRLQLMGIPFRPAFTGRPPLDSQPEPLPGNPFQPGV